MTEEKLRLEIQIEVQKALASLKQTQTDIKKLSQDVKSLGPSTEQTKAIIANLNKEIQSSAQFARLMGNEAQGLKEKQQALQAAMRQLIDQGLDPQSEQLQDLKRQYDETGEKLENMGEGANALEAKLMKLAESGTFAIMAKQVAQFAAASVTAFAEAEQSAKRLEMAMAMRGSADGAERIAKFASELQTLTGASDDYVKQLAAELAMQGKSESQIKQILTVAADLSAVTGQDLASSVQELTGTLSGMVGHIGRSIPQLKDLTEEELKAGKAIEIVGRLYAGSAQTMSSTSAVAFKRMKETVGDLSEAIGEVLAPVFTLAANAVTTLAGAMANAGPVVKMVMGGAVAALAAGLAALAIKAGIAAAAQWTHFAALQAVNAAMAVTNPLLIAGIAAATAAAVAVTAYAVSQANAAKATSSGIDAHNTAAKSFDATATAVDRAKKALEAYKNSLKDKSIAELQATMATLQGQLVDYHSKAAYSRYYMEAIADTQNQIKVVEALLQQKKDEVASKWKQQWAETYQQFQAQQSGDPYAEIELERKKKLEDAAQAYIGKANKETIDQINTYYDAERRKVAQSIALAEREQLAKITETRIDDLELERDKTLASFRGTEEARSQIAAYYERLITQTKQDEAKKAAQAAQESTLKNAEFEASLTESRVDDLKVEMQRRLASFEGTEEQKAQLAAWYAKKISETEQDEAKKAADARIKAMKEAFEQQKAMALQNKDWFGYASAVVQEKAASAEVGKMAGFAGGFAANPVLILIEAAADFVLSIENVTKVLNPFKTIFEGARTLLEPLINDALQPLVDLLTDVGEILAQVLAPIISSLAIGLRLFAAVLQVAQLPIKFLGQALAWLNDRVIVPVGNAIIDLINGVIGAINWALGWAGVNISYIERLKTTTEIAEQEAIIKKKMEEISDQMQALRDDFSRRRQEINDAYQKNLSSLRKLLEIGALGEEEYARRVTTLNVQKEQAIALLDQTEKSQLTELQKIYDQLSKGINVYTQNGSAPSSSSSAPNPNNTSALQDAAIGAVSGAAVGAGIGSIIPGIGTAIGAAVGGVVGTIGGAIGGLFGWWDVGAVELPQDMAGVVHKGEMIVPATFAEGIRSGKLTLGSGVSSGRAEVYNITVNVEGSVKTESDLVDSIALALAKKRSRNLLPAGV
ncbi:hypothetical protein [Gracilinema caldarium]|uniref:hypothetical protein n=1 Tax=Gracilinema caldarium TaxID=215591 RepID=UPI0026F34878|nr:hypothetical protein [Gracilinema caldarium]